jgi:hypothetical protein
MDGWKDGGISSWMLSTTMTNREKNLCGIDDELEERKTRVFLSVFEKEKCVRLNPSQRFLQRKSQHMKDTSCIRAPSRTSSHLAHNNKHFKCGGKRKFSSQRIPQTNLSPANLSTYYGMCRR